MPSDPGAFTWNGPVESNSDSLRKDQQREHDIWLERMEWFGEDTTAGMASPVQQEARQSLIEPRSAAVRGEFACGVENGVTHSVGFRFA